MDEKESVDIEQENDVSFRIFLIVTFPYTRIFVFLGKTTESVRQREKEPGFVLTFQNIVQVINHGTLQIRVDFVDTELVDPVRGECLSQFFIVQGAIWPTGLPPLCGINNDQHCEFGIS